MKYAPNPDRRQRRADDRAISASPIWAVCAPVVVQAPRILSRWPQHEGSLGAVHVITTLTGSALLALALLRRQISPEQAWLAAHVDEDWNMEQWGRDELALERRAFRLAEFQAAAKILSEITGAA